MKIKYLCLFFMMFACSTPQKTETNSQKDNNIMEVKQILKDENYPDLKTVSDAIDKNVEFNDIACINWGKFSYKPKVKFAIAYNNKEIFIKYVVSEQSVRALAHTNNGEVWKDSCCEFFVSPTNDDYYYNFETNCIGTLLLGYRKMGDKTEHANDQIAAGVRRFSTLGNKPFDTKTGNFEWQMIVAIPLTAFFKNDIQSLKGKTFSANFYKCGDDLPVPHYLSWKPIRTENPNFHQPAFFSKIKFI